MSTGMKYTATPLAGLDKSDLLAHYKNRSQYIPQYGDYIVFAKWFTTWHGVITDYDSVTDELHIIFAGVPYLLFTMNESEQAKETYKITLREIKNSRNGKYAIQQQDKATGTPVWYI